MERNDLTKGPIASKMLKYFLPLAAGNIFQQLYFAVDALIVGRYAGTLALAAVGGSASAVSLAVTNFFIALCGGGTILIAQFYGANNYGALKKAVHSSILFSFIIGLIISGSAYMLTERILLLTKVPAESLALSRDYMQIIFAGLIFALVFNMAAGILRAVGDSKTPFIIVTASCIINIVFDYVLIAVVDLGVTGAAIATIFSQFVCALVAVLKLVFAGDKVYRLRLSCLRIDFRILGRMLAVGVPLALQSVMYSITNVASQVCINTLGTVAVASWGLLGRIDGFFWAMMSAANTTMSNFAGQNFGKKDYERMKKGLVSGLIIFECIAVIYSVILLSCGRSIVPLFDPNPDVVSTTVTMFFCFAPFYPVWVVNEVFSGSLRGEGKTLVPFFILMFSVCIFRLIWMNSIFVAHPTIPGLALMYPVSWAIADIGIVTYYFLHIKKNRATPGARSQEGTIS